MKRNIVRYGLVGIGVIILVGLGMGMDQEVATERTDTKSPYAGECSADGIQYRRQYTRADLESIFGDPDQVEKGLVPVQLLGKTIRLHPKVAACVAAVERERVAQGITYSIDDNDPLGGIGGYRASDSQLGESSYHRYGAALDLNPSQNPHCRSSGAVDPNERCASDRPYTVPDELVQVFKNHGFTWGGNWRRDKDYMHFEWHGEQP